MPDVLIVADTFRSPELRHELPAPSGDPILYAEVDGARHVLAPSHEAPIIAAAGDYHFHAPEEYGVEELRRTLSSYDEMFVELIVRAVRALGIERALVPDLFPVYAADRLPGRGSRARDGSRVLHRSAPRRKSAAELEDPAVWTWLRRRPTPGWRRARGGARGGRAGRRRHSRASTTRRK